MKAYGLILCAFVAGAIELAIFSEYYGREIAAYNIQTARCDLYGQVFFFKLNAMCKYDVITIQFISDCNRIEAIVKG